MSRHMAVAVVLSALYIGCPAVSADWQTGLAVIDDPNPADYQLNEGERLIMVVPSVDATSRYVPPEQAFGGASAVAAAPRPMPAAPRRDAGKFSPVNQVMVDDARSEVANETFRRTRGGKKDVVAQDEKIPWWKGGLWRNKSDDGGSGDSGDERESNRNNNAPNRSRGRAYAPSADRDDDPVAARRRNSGGSGRRASRPAEDDLWDDDGGGYNGYDDGGDFGRQANAPRQSGYGAPAGDFDPYAQSPSGGDFDPYAQQGNPYPGQQGYGAPQDQAFTDPNAPLGAYVDPSVPAPSLPYDTSMYGSVPAVDAATGQPIAPYGGGYAADPYAQPYGDPYGDQSDPFAALPTQAPMSSSASLDPQGGPQFENAVRMVKENRFTEAKAILASETARNPSNAAAWRWLADCHYNLLELDDAIRAYQRSLDQDHGDYYALRGQGFSYLHRGHEYWRRMQEEVAQNKKDEAASTFALAHDDYKKALEMLGLCLRRAPNDGEAVYGEAMAAEGASRKLYSNAISYLKLGPDQRERAELFAENCLTVINKGIERSKERTKQAPGDSGPRALLGGLYLRKATLYRQLGKNDLALIELKSARDTQQSILDEIDKNNPTAQKATREIETLWEQWGGNA